MTPTEEVQTLKAQLQCAREATEVYAKWWRNAYALRISRTQRWVLEAMGSASDEELRQYVDVDGTPPWLARVAKAELFRRQT
jgi:hypothetical protein